MARKTDYQKQADKRTKDALRLRARHDARARKYAGYLMAALVGADDARARLDRINQLYGVDISTETILIHDLRTADTGGLLGGLLGQSTPGEEVQLLNPTVDANGGALLAAEALFGEVAPPAGSPAPTPTSTPTPTPTSTPPPIDVTELSVALQQGEWWVSVEANAPSGSYLVVCEGYESERQFYNGRLRSFGPLARTAGQQVKVTLTDFENRALVVERTLTLV